MPYKYTDEQKLQAMRLLAETFGNTAYVSEKTGISQRTLQYWKERYRLHVTIHPEDPEDPAAKYFREQYRFLQVKLFKQIGDIIEHMERYNSVDVAAKLTPALARLIDRITKLEDLLTDKDFSLHIRWVNPDQKPEEAKQVIETPKNQPE